MAISGAMPFQATPGADPGEGFVGVGQPPQRQKRHFEAIVVGGAEFGAVNRLR